MAPAGRRHPETIVASSTASAPSSTHCKVSSQSLSRGSPASTSCVNTPIIWRTRSRRPAPSHIIPASARTTVRSRTSQARVSAHRWAWSRVSGSGRWAAASLSRNAQARRRSRSSGPQYAVSPASSTSASSTGSFRPSAIVRASSAKGRARWGSPAYAQQRANAPARRAWGKGSVVREYTVCRRTGSDPGVSLYS
jgi:hypothetical protein